MFVNFRIFSCFQNLFTNSVNVHVFKICSKNQKMFIILKNVCLFSKSVYFLEFLDKFRTVHVLIISLRIQKMFGNFVKCLSFETIVHNSVKCSHLLILFLFFKNCSHFHIVVRSFKKNSHFQFRSFLFKICSRL